MSAPLEMSFYALIYVRRGCVAGLKKQEALKQEQEERRRRKTGGGGGRLEEEEEVEEEEEMEIRKNMFDLIIYSKNAILQDLRDRL